jgi:hypothetical protein
MPVGISIQRESLEVISGAFGHFLIGAKVQRRLDCLKMVFSQLLSELINLVGTVDMSIKKVTRNLRAVQG